MKKTPLDDLRAAVKERDRELVRLLNERAKLSVEIGRVKAVQNRPVYDPAQEAEVYARLEALNEGPLTGPALRDVFREILSQSRALQTPMTVAYLGPEASFSHLAALSHFGRQARYVHAATIAEVFDAAEKDKGVWGIVPV
ncbi:MAG: chorismate mutase, partial [Syntrophales bacterium]